MAVTADGTVWGIHHGEYESAVIRFDGQHLERVAELEKLSVGIVWSIATAPDGTLWVGSEGGLAHFDGRHWDYFLLDMQLLPGRWGINAAGVVTLAVMQDGSVWCGTQAGVARFRPPA